MPHVRTLPWGAHGHDAGLRLARRHAPGVPQALSWRRTGDHGEAALGHAQDRHPARPPRSCVLQGLATPRGPSLPPRPLALAPSKSQAEAAAAAWAAACGPPVYTRRPARPSARALDLGVRWPRGSSGVACGALESCESTCFAFARLCSIYQRQTQATRRSPRAPPLPFPRGTQAGPGVPPHRTGLVALPSSSGASGQQRPWRRTAGRSMTASCMARAATSSRATPPPFPWRTRRTRRRLRGAASAAPGARAAPLHRARATAAARLCRCRAHRRARRQPHGGAACAWKPPSPRAAAWRCGRARAAQIARLAPHAHHPRAAPHARWVPPIARHAPPSPPPRAPHARPPGQRGAAGGAQAQCGGPR